MKSYTFGTATLGEKDKRLSSHLGLPQFGEITNKFPTLNYEDGLESPCKKKQNVFSGSTIFIF